MPRSSDLSPRRIAAIGLSLAAHLALLLLLLGERPPPAVQLSSEPIIVRLIPEPRVANGVIAGSTLATTYSTVPTPAEATPKARPAPKKVAAKRPPRPTERVFTLGQLPPPTLDAIKPDAGASFADVTNPALASIGVTGNPGNRRGGNDGSGNSESIQFARKAPLALPPAMRARGWSGYVLLGLRVAADGRLREIVVLRSSGENAVDRIARQAASRSAYLPHRKNGRAIEFWAVLPVVFGNAVPDLDRDLATLAPKWRSGHPGREALREPRPAV
jgi:protein TonB